MPQVPVYMESPGKYVSFVAWITACKLLDCDTASMAHCDVTAKKLVRLDKYPPDYDYAYLYTHDNHACIHTLMHTSPFTEALSVVTELLNVLVISSYASFLWKGLMTGNVMDA
jgi:hypothetical protein